MASIKFIIAKNITKLRISHHMTQCELAEKLNYSDKAVSKWERGESVPEIGTLVAIADLFDVPLDCILREDYEIKDSKKEIALTKNIKISNHSIITGMSVWLVIFIALLVYIVIDITYPKITVHWLTFIYAIPVSLIVWLVLNSIWFNKRRNFLIISLLMWSFLASLHISFLVTGINIWQIYILGIPPQAVIVMWSKLKFKRKKHNSV